jgi:hypothetical protein
MRAGLRFIGKWQEQGYKCYIEYEIHFIYKTMDICIKILEVYITKMSTVIISGG